MFTESEANALITAEQFILKNKDASFVKEYSEAISKINPFYAVLQKSFFLYLSSLRSGNPVLTFADNQFMEAIVGP